MYSSCVEFRSHPAWFCQHRVVFTISKSNVKYVEQNVDVIGEEYHVICLANTSDNKILAKIHTLLRFVYPFQKIIIIGLVVIT